jgi:RNA polymerase sigma-70 factor (ECF subfamily)
MHISVIAVSFKPDLVIGKVKVQFRLATMAQSLGDPSDDELVRLARQGDEAAFLVVFERHRDVIFRLAARLAHSEFAAEDITQDCFLSLLNNHRSFDAAKGPLRTYLYAVVRNLARKHYWLHENEVDLDNGAGDTRSMGTLEAPHMILRQEVSEMVQQAIAALPGPQREALILFQYEELPLEEIACILGIEVGAVKSRLHRARETLRMTLSPHFQRSISNEAVR